ncbi:unnamed protein product [Caenorhabditis bovis]|uniref:F-box domain-containing protein n=1 Tax=Caenorhabditis bovis TaxID=2654633 RepID=A0A8S1EZ22_9PELO|nr:unnamed protein product [Caenorhabditis bovis]
MHRLPIEVIERIFEFLPQKSKLSFFLTLKNFPISLFLREIECSNLADLLSSLAIENRFRHVRRLRIVKKLEMSRIIQDLGTIREKMPNLRTLEFRDIQFREITCSNIAKRKVGHDIDNLIWRSFYKEIGKLPRLKKLSFNGSTINVENLKLIFEQNSPKIVELDLRNTKTCLSETDLKYLRENTSIRIIHIDSMNRNSTENFKWKTHGKILTLAASHCAN